MIDMEINDYFAVMEKGAQEAYKVAAKARAIGYDPETVVEITPAPDLPSRVEGIVGLKGLAELISAKITGMSRQEASFKIVKEICTDEKFFMAVEDRLLLAVRVGLSILTEGILVAPTEGIQGVVIHKNPDNTNYISVVYAGPIRGAGGTSAALSVTLADYGRKILGIGEYKPQRTEVERYLEEIQIYHARVARLQYLPSESDMRLILENCPVCIDGLPTEELEVSVHRNVKRLDADGKEQVITNRIRGGIGLVVCEGIAQKAKSVLKYSKAAGLDWGWLNSIIKVDKGVSYSKMRENTNDVAFLQELVGGRPILSYPDYPGGFRLRYGRSRYTGIAAKGFSPATMIILEEFIAVGTQIKIDKPGKGSIAMPVDTIEGPFVKLNSGELRRINSAEEAHQVINNVEKILSVGDILITIGDFKKTNTPLIPSSYVEELWYSDLEKNGYKGEMPCIRSFREAFQLSIDYKVPMHPAYTYEYQDISTRELAEIAAALIDSDIRREGNSIFSIKDVTIKGENSKKVRSAIERLCIPCFDTGDITIMADHAQSLFFSLGLFSGDEIKLNTADIGKYTGEDIISVLNSLSPFKVMKRSYRIGARVGRPEKARERLMRPAPNGMFPVGDYGGKERNIAKAYYADKKRLGPPKIELEMARYICSKGGEAVSAVYCREHKCRARQERICVSCGRKSSAKTCVHCGRRTSGSEVKNIDMQKEMESALSNLGVQSIPKIIKGVKGMMNRDKVAEPLEKAILRSINGVYVFKDGTCRFDATDAPITHFYPSEISTSVETLKQLGYTVDYTGRLIESPEQLVELKHQDVIINTRCADYLLKVAKFIDDLLIRYYKIEPFYNSRNVEDLVGKYVVTLSPHTSAGVLNRIIGFTDANVGLAHPYTIQARRRNCDGDEDTMMLLLDALINFSKDYLPSIIGGTMDAPLILTERILPEEIDDEVWNMEVTDKIKADFYEKAAQRRPPSEVVVESVGDRRNTEAIYKNLLFTHNSSSKSMQESPKKSIYTKLKTMDEKIELQFRLMDKLYTIDKQDTARRLISSHFIPDLMGNLHSFSKQSFRCVSCNAKYRRVPIIGKCTKCSGKIVLTISKGGIEKYLNMAINLAERYDLEPYMKQRIYLIKFEIENVFGGLNSSNAARQFNLSKFM